jgi:phosphatidate phosphatase APP1
MSWQRFLAQSIVDIEERFDLLKYRLRERRGNRPPIIIYPYRGFGSREKIYFRGRVLEDKGIEEPTDNDSIWNNLINMYRRFETDEIPYAKVRARFQNLEQIIQCDVEGHFELVMQVTAPLPEDKLWHEVELELVEPLREGAEPVRCTASVMIPPSSAKFGVISDIDDTVLHTDATNLIRMARTVFLGNAHTRLPFKGVAAFYRALFEGSSGSDQNPLFYVSSSPWNLYDLLSDFFNLQDIPIGPVLFLRDWGINEREILPINHREYKYETITKIMTHFPDLPFVLVGDSGQEDPEIYHEVVDQHPERILAVYIRNVSRDLKRPDAINLLAEEVLEAGSTLILAEETTPMAEHAAKNHWISAAALPAIRAKVEADTAPPSLLEKLVGQDLEVEAEPPVVMIDEGDEEQIGQTMKEGKVEEAMEIGEEQTKKPPTVIVDGEEAENKPLKKKP